jgi:hypothetical protein
VSIPATTWTVRGNQEQLASILSFASSSAAPSKWLAVVEPCHVTTELIFAIFRPPRPA